MNFLCLLVILSYSLVAFILLLIFSTYLFAMLKDLMRFMWGIIIMFNFSKSFCQKLALVTLCSSILTLTACTTTTHYGSKQIRNIPVPLYYTVQYGDSLSKIGQKYALDYVSIAQINNIPAPYNLIHVGQKLRLKGAKRLQVMPNKSTTSTTTVNKPTPVITTPIPNNTVSSNVYQQWRKPTLNHYSPTLNSSNYALYYFGQMDDPIYAVASGTVVYASPTNEHGDLARFGNLIMIQHDNGYVSVYAHNNNLLVHNGQIVQAGQQIATMGMSGLDVQQPMLVFQLKQGGQAVDARTLIP